jgi:hypothetical protein
MYVCGKFSKESFAWKVFHSAEIKNSAEKILDVSKFKFPKICGKSMWKIFVFTDTSD